MIVITMMAMMKIIKVMIMVKIDATHDVGCQIMMVMMAIEIDDTHDDSCQMMMVMMTGS